MRTGTGNEDSEDGDDEDSDEFGSESNMKYVNLQVYFDEALFEAPPIIIKLEEELIALDKDCLLYTSPSPRDKRQSRMPSSA